MLTTWRLLVQPGNRYLSTKPSLSRRALLQAIDDVLSRSRPHPVGLESLGRSLHERFGRKGLDLHSRLRDFGGLLKLVQDNSVDPSPRYKIIERDRSESDNSFESRFSLSLYGGDVKKNSHEKRGINKSAKEGSSEDSNNLTVATINSTMNVYAKSGDLKSCIAWFKLINELGMKPDTYSISIMIKAHCRAADVSGAIKWLNVMESEGISPLVYHINPIIATYAKNGDISNTLHWFEAMQTKYEVQPDMHTYSSVLVGHLEAGEPEKAIELFESTLHKSPDLVMYNNAINCYAAANDLEGAIRAFAMIKEAGLLPSVREYSSLIFAHARHGEGVQAELVLESMKNDGIKPTLHTLTSVITAWSKSGNIERVTYWLNRLLEAGIKPSNRTINSVIYAHSQALDVAGAVYYFDNIHSLYGLRPDVYSVNMIMKALLAKVPADYDGAFKLWASYFMHPSGAATSLGGSGNNIGVNVHPITAPLRPNHQSYSIIVAACRNNKKKASFWFGYMLKSGLEPDEKILKLLRSTIGEKRFAAYCRNVAERDLESDLDTEIW